MALAMAVATVLPASAAAAQPAPSLSSAELNLEVGGSAQLTAALGGADVTGGVIWTSDTPAVAAVSRGTVRAAGAGTATVTATAGNGRNASCVIRVAQKGIDVSSYQGVISWAEVKQAGISFALLRTGYGDESPETQTDSTFAANYDGARAAGIKVGVYHVSYATTTDEAVTEANFCLSILNGKSLDYPVFYDLEPSEKTGQENLTADQLSRIAVAFCNTIKNAGYQAGVYSTDNVFGDRLWEPAIVTYDYWVAHTGVSHPNVGAYTIWQYSHTGTVPGVAGDVDLDYSYRDYPAAAPAAADISFLSDSPAAMTLLPGKTYTFKFTPNGVSAAPRFASGNSGAVRVVSVRQIGISYYVKVLAVKPGCTSVYSVLSGRNPARRCVVTIS